MSFDDQVRETLERVTAVLRAQLERDLSAVGNELKRVAVEERERTARATAEVDVLKRAIAEERERSAQQAAEAAAADMRWQAETQAQIAQVQDAARRRIEEIQRAVAEERDRAVQQASEAATAEARRQADVQIEQLRDAAQKHAQEVRRSAESQVGELRSTLQAQLEEVRRTAHAQTEETRRTSHVEIEDARRVAAAQVDDVQRKADEQLAHMRRDVDVQVEEARRVAAAQVDDVQRKADEQLAHMRRDVDVQVEEARRVAAAQVDDVQRRADEQLAQMRHDVEVQIEDVQRRARVELEKAHADLETVRAEAETGARAVRAEAEEIVIAQLAAAHADVERRIAEAVDRTRTDAVQADLAHTARLVDAIRRLDDAGSLGEALDTLAECAGRQVERAALLVVRGDKLRVHRLAGFAGEQPGVDLDLQAAGLAGAVVSTGVAVSRAAVEPGDEQSSRQPALPTFAQDAGVRHAVALPIVVGGHVVAVLYADAPRTGVPSAASRWPATLEVLARHASRALEAMTVQRASGLSLPRPAPRAARSAVPGPVEHGGAGDEDAARRYARLLVSEIRMYHEPLVDAGRRSRDLRARLGGEIDRARRLYEQRIPQAIRERSDYFEQELVRTLADGDRSLLG